MTRKIARAYPTVESVWIFIFCLSFFTFFSCSKKQETTSPQTLETPFEIIDNLGNKREYRVFVPASQQGEGEGKSKRLPLVLYFHGVWSEEFKKIPALKNYTGSPVEETGLIGLSQGKEFFLVVPKAFYEVKALRSTTARGWKLGEEIDGIEKIIDKVVMNYPIDTGKIYLTGISAGAVLCHYLANRRPGYYAAILSHSQAYTDEHGGGKVRTPAVKGPQFGVLFAYNDGDYANLIEYCLRSYRVYKEYGYRTECLKDLPPRGHAWSVKNNEKFWDLLQQLSPRASDNNTQAIASPNRESK